MYVNIHKLAVVASTFPFLEVSLSICGSIDRSVSPNFFWAISNRETLLTSHHGKKECERNRRIRGEKGAFIRIVYSLVFVSFVLVELWMVDRSLAAHLVNNVCTRIWISLILIRLLVLLPVLRAIRIHLIWF